MHLYPRRRNNYVAEELKTVSYATPPMEERMKTKQKKAQNDPKLTLCYPLSPERGHIVFALLNHFAVNQGSGHNPLLFALFLIQVPAVDVSLPVPWGHLSGSDVLDVTRLLSAGVLLGESDASTFVRALPLASVHGPVAVGLNGVAGDVAPGVLDVLCRTGERAAV